MHTTNRLYVLYDAKAEETMGNPFMYRADAAAIRGFKELMNDPKQFFYRHPEDYSLLYLGTLNCKDGAMPYIEAETMLVSAGKEAQQDELPFGEHPVDLQLMAAADKSIGRAQAK